MPSPSGLRWSVWQTGTIVSSGPRPRIATARALPDRPPSAPATAVTVLLHTGDQGPLPDVTQPSLW